MQDVRRGMSDEDLVTECCRLQGLDELSRCEEMRLEIVQDEFGVSAGGSRVESSTLSVQYFGVRC